MSNPGSTTAPGAQSADAEALAELLERSEAVVDSMYISDYSKFTDIDDGYGFTAAEYTGVLSGQNITTNTGAKTYNTINTNSMYGDSTYGNGPGWQGHGGVGGGPGWSHFGSHGQDPECRVFGFTPITMAAIVASDTLSEELEGDDTDEENAVALMWVVFYNISDNEEMTKIPVKFVLISGGGENPSFYGYDATLPGPSFTDLTVYDPFSFKVPGSTALSPEGQSLFAKFNPDPTVGSATAPGEYAQTVIANYSNQLFNDLQQGVLSRFDTMKTTHKFVLNKNSFEKITLDESAETRAINLSYETKTLDVINSNIIGPGGPDYG